MLKKVNKDGGGGGMGVWWDGGVVEQRAWELGAAAGSIRLRAAMDSGTCMGRGGGFESGGSEVTEFTEAGWDWVGMITQVASVVQGCRSSVGAHSQCRLPVFANAPRPWVWFAYQRHTLFPPPSS